MKFLLCVLSILLASCGKGASTSDSTPISIIPVTILLPTKANTRVYIIGGQSNAERLLSTLYDIPLVNTSMFSADPNKNSAIGYGVDGTNLEFWKDPINNAPLLQVINTFCPVSPYFIWWQGEADSGHPLIDTYKIRVTDFLGKLQAICPAMKIIVISLEVEPSVSANAAIMESIQENLGYPWISARGYSMVSVEHLDPAGYLNFWKDLTEKFPL